MTENTAQEVMPPDVQPNDAATTQAFWTAASCWIMWNVCRWTGGTSHL